MTDAGQLISQRDAKLSTIDANPELTTEAKEARKAAVRETYQREYEEGRAKEQARIEKNLQSTKKSMYGLSLDIGSSKAESAQVYAAFRNAWFDVVFQTEGDGLRNAGETLSGMLEQATRIGDELMASAIYHRALDLGQNAVIEAYHAAHPEAARKYERYQEAKAEYDNSRDLVTQLFAAQERRAFS